MLKGEKEMGNDGTGKGGGEETSGKERVRRGSGSCPSPDPLLTFSRCLLNLAASADVIMFMGANRQHCRNKA